MKYPPTVAILFAVLMLCRYEVRIAVLKINETTAMLKYMYVGQVTLSFAHAVRVTGRPPTDSFVTVLKSFRVLKYLCNVMASGTRTAMDKHAATTRDMIFSLLMRCFRYYSIRLISTANRPESAFFLTISCF